jgi:phosphodiesterase/alkaline phosphatase D-like protein
LTGLNPNTTYHYQLVANNSAGTTFGGDQTFITAINGSAPTVLTGGASSIGTTSVFMNGSVNPNGLPTTAYFEWGTSTAYGNTVPNPPFNSGSGNNKIGTSAELTGLSLDTTYHYQIVAVNSVGTTYGGDQTFTTTGLFPIPTTGAASGISATRAFMNGSVNPNGLPTTAYFEWGTSTAYGNTVPNPSFNTGNGNTNIGVSLELTGLRPNTTYHYQLLATNTVGSAYGGDQMFITVGLPVLGPIQLLPNGAVQFTLAGSIGQSYIIMASTNLVNWVTVTNLTLTSATEQFVDFSATNFDHRFYCVVLP